MSLKIQLIEDIEKIKTFIKRVDKKQELALPMNSSFQKRNLEYLKESKIGLMLLAKAALLGMEQEIDNVITSLDVIELTAKTNPVKKNIALLKEFTNKFNINEAINESGLELTPAKHIKGNKQKELIQNARIWLKHEILDFEALKRELGYLKKIV